MSLRTDNLNNFCSDIKDVCINDMNAPDSGPINPKNLDDIILSIPSGSGTISTGEWIRPTNRPNVPTVNADEIYYLYKVNPIGINDIALQFNFTGNCIVDWGDGNNNNLITGTLTQYLYNFNNINVQVNDDGSKWVWIHVYATSGNITTCYSGGTPNTRATTSYYSPNVFEIYANLPSASLSHINNNSNYKQCEIMNFYALNNLSISSSQLLGMLTSLKNCTFPGPITGTGMFNGSYMLEKITLLSGYYRADQNQMLMTPHSLREITLDFNNYGTNIAAGIFNALGYSLRKFRFLNMGSAQTTVNLSYSKIDLENLKLLIGDLYDRSSTTTGTLNLTATPAGSQATASDIALATAKNWNVIQ